MADKLTFSKMMVLADGSESGVHAAQCAVRFAAAQKAKLLAIAVVNTDLLKSLLSSGVLVEAEMVEFDHDLEVSAQANIHYVEQLAHELGVDLEVVLRKGAVHTVVTDELRRYAADLLVMGSFSSLMIKLDLNARDRRLIVDGTHCPILLIP